MKKKRKKKMCIALNSHQGLGSAPDVPARQNSGDVLFAADLFGPEELEDVEVKVFEMKVAENVTVKWETVICGNQLFINVPSILSPVGSKESFISLLEIAEEKLGCESVICCVQSAAKERFAQMRTFRFMGFQPIPPTSPLLPSVGKMSGKYFFLGYEL